MEGCVVLPDALRSSRVGAWEAPVDAGLVSMTRLTVDELIEPNKLLLIPSADSCDGSSLSLAVEVVSGPTVGMSDDSALNG